MTDREKLKLLIEAIDYSFWNPLDKDYNKELTLPVIDKVKYIKRLISEESISEDLEEEFTKCYESRIDLMMTRKQFGEIIHRFTNWQKEQMMANVVDGVVHHFGKCEMVSVHYNDPTGVPMAYFTSSKGLSAGDKVKVIVIKED